MQNMFNDYNPTDDDLAFDPDDLVGIAELNDDPLFKKTTIIKDLYDKVIDEATAQEEINSVEKSIEFEVDETVPEPDYSDIMPDDSDVTFDGQDAEEMMDAAHEILSGEADDESDMIDFIENKN